MIKILCLIILLSSRAYGYIPITTDARIKTIIYSPTEVFKLKFHHNYQSYLEFPKGEKFKIISLGDSFAWDIKQVDNRIFIKPKQAGVLTNMTIITSKRPYHFEIYSSLEELSITDPSLVYVARFYYPETAYDFMQTVRIKKPLSQYNIKLDETEVKLQKSVVEQQEGDLNLQANAQTDIQSSSPAEDSGLYNYAYSMVGPDLNITPAKVYDDGVNTYFEFKGNVLPDIFYVNPDGSEITAQYTVANGVVSVKSIRAQFTVRDNNNVICIFNEGQEGGQW